MHRLILVDQPGAHAIHSRTPFWLAAQPAASGAKDHGGRQTRWTPVPDRVCHSFEWSCRAMDRLVRRPHRVSS